MNCKTRVKHPLRTALALTGMLALLSWIPSNAHANQAYDYPSSPASTVITNPGPLYPQPHPLPPILPGERCPAGVVVTTHAGAAPICQHPHSTRYYERASRICNDSRYPAHLYSRSGRSTLYPTHCTEAILLFNVTVSLP